MAVKPIETKNKFSQAKLLAGAVKHKRSASPLTTNLSLTMHSEMPLVVGIRAKGHLSLSLCEPPLVALPLFPSNLVSSLAFHLCLSASSFNVIIATLHWAPAVLQALC